MSGYLLIVLILTAKVKDCNMCWEGARKGGEGKEDISFR